MLKRLGPDYTGQMIGHWRAERAVPDSEGHQWAFICTKCGDELRFYPRAKFLIGGFIAKCKLDNSRGRPKHHPGETLPPDAIDPSDSCLD